MSNKAGEEKQKDGTKRPLVPRLRFPEFREAGEWKKKTLAEVLTFQAGFPFDSASFTKKKCNGLRLVRNRDLKSDDKIIFYSGLFDKNYVVDDGDVLVGMDGDFTPCVWNKGKALLNQRVGRIITREWTIQRFMYYFLMEHLKTIEEATARTTVKHLSHSDVEKICEPLPAFTEQQKIADCLSSLDDLITLEGQKDRRTQDP
jgi:type I restriction enzyme S subunit